jgi:hypothetical protein
MKNKNIEVDYQIIDFAGNVHEKLDKEAGTIIIKDINFPVCSINFYYENDKDYTLEYMLSFSSYSAKYEQNNLSHKAMTTKEKNYINFYTGSDCRSITVSLLTTEEIDLKIEKIVLNEVNFNISIVRILILGIFIYFLKNVFYSEKIYLNKMKKDRFILDILILICCMLISTFFIIITKNEDANPYFSLTIFFVFAILFKILYDKLIKYLNLEDLNKFAYYIGYFSIIICSNICYLIVEEKFQLNIMIGVTILSAFWILSLYLKDIQKNFLKNIILISNAIILGILLYINIIFFILALVPIIIFIIEKLEVYITKYKSEKYKITNITLLKNILLILGLIIISVLTFVLIMLVCKQNITSVFEFECSYNYKDYKTDVTQFVKNIMDYFLNPPKYSLTTYPYSQIQSTTNSVFEDKSIFILGMTFIPLFWMIVLKNKIMDKQDKFNRVINWNILLILLSIAILSKNNIVLEEYSIIFKYILSILSIFTIFKLLAKYKSRDVIGIFIILVVISCTITLPIGLSTSNAYLNDAFNLINRTLQGILSFWE